jgi:serine/threonine protein kinase
VKITLGTTRGMAYLHSVGSGGKFIHGNIKSSNILLSQELGACVTEFGLAQLMSTPPRPPTTHGMAYLHSVCLKYERLCFSGLIEMSFIFYDYACEQYLVLEHQRS